MCPGSNGSKPEFSPELQDPTNLYQAVLGILNEGLPFNFTQLRYEVVNNTNVPTNLITPTNLKNNIVRLEDEGLLFQSTRSEEFDRDPIHLLWIFYRDEHFPIKPENYLSMLLYFTEGVRPTEATTVDAVTRYILNKDEDLLRQQVYNVLDQMEQRDLIELEFNSCKFTAKAYYCYTP